MLPVVTVIIPAYNAEKYLDECIGSVAGQSHGALQIVVVDDGSTDGSAEICRRWERADSRVSVARQPNAGLSAARNRGLDIAEGEYVAFVDADDVLHPMFVERMLLLVQGRDIARCAVAEGAECRWPAVRGEARRLDAATAIERMLYQHGWHNGVWAHLYRRELFRCLRFRENTLYEDLDIIYRIYEQAARGVAYTDAAMYFYRRHGGSLLGAFTMSRTRVLDVVDRMERYFQADSRLASAARHRRFSAYFNMLGLLSRHGESAYAKDRCWPVIVQLRREVLSNPQSRLKNRAGALLSYLGPQISISVSKHLIR